MSRLPINIAIVSVGETYLEHWNIYDETLNPELFSHQSFTVDISRFHKYAAGFVH